MYRGCLKSPFNCHFDQREEIYLIVNKHIRFLGADSNIGTLEMTTWKTFETAPFFIFLNFKIR